MINPKIKPILKGGEVYLNKKKATRIETNEMRKIYFCGKYVIKIAGRDCLPEHNIDEGKLWEKVSRNKKLKKYFVPIINYGSKFVIQPKIYFRNPIRNRKQYKVIKKVVDKFGLSDVYPEKNWGIKRNGQSVIFDYGL